MICKNCKAVMLIMMNTTRPMTLDNSLVVRYLCTYCGQWCTVVYKHTQIIWDKEEEDAILDIDDDHKDEELYFVGRHDVKQNENK